jgi:hypothetical protein
MVIRKNTTIDYTLTFHSSIVDSHWKKSINRCICDDIQCILLSASANSHKLVLNRHFYHCWTQQGSQIMSKPMVLFLLTNQAWNKRNATVNSSIYAEHLATITFGAGEHTLLGMYQVPGSTTCTIAVATGALPNSFSFNSFLGP